MSIYPAMNSMFNLKVPMPIPRTANAPFFNGRYIDDFLNRILLHANQAGESDRDQMVKYILDYSSDQVKDTITDMDQFNIDAPQTLNWQKAKDALHGLYGSTDKSKRYTEEELKEFCRQSSAKSSFSKLLDVKTYYRDFVGIAASLKKRGLITEKCFDHFFVLGLPHSMKDWFINATPEANRTSNDPPTLEDSLKILKNRFDKKSLIYEEWSLEDNDKAKPIFDDYGNRVSVTIPPQGNILDMAVAYLPQNVKNDTNSRSQQIPPSAIDDLAKRVEALTLALSGRQNIQMVQNLNPQGGPPRPLRCFICGNPCGPDGVHPTGPRFCPETSGLLADRLMDFNTQ